MALKSVAKGIFEHAALLRAPDKQNLLRRSFAAEGSDSPGAACGTDHLWCSIHPTQKETWNRIKKFSAGGKGTCLHPHLGAIILFLHLSTPFAGKHRHRLSRLVKVNEGSQKWCS